LDNVVEIIAECASLYQADSNLSQFRFLGDEDLLSMAAKGAAIIVAFPSCVEVKYNWLSREASILSILNNKCLASTGKARKALRKVHSIRWSDINSIYKAPEINKANFKVNLFDTGLDESDDEYSDDEVDDEEEGKQKHDSDRSSLLPCARDLVKCLKNKVVGLIIFDHCALGAIASPGMTPAQLIARAEDDLLRFIHVLVSMTDNCDVINIDTQIIIPHLARLRVSRDERWASIVRRFQVTLISAEDNAVYRSQSVYEIGHDTADKINDGALRDIGAHADYPFLLLQRRFTNQKIGSLSEKSKKPKKPVNYAEVDYDDNDIAIKQRPARDNKDDEDYVQEDELEEEEEEEDEEIVGKDASTYLADEQKHESEEVSLWVNNLSFPEYLC
jgi:hypothetical protein